MKKIITVSAMLLSALQFSVAQKNIAKPGNSESQEVRKELINEFRQESVTRGNAGVSSAVSASDVGEPDSFEKNARFMGIAASGIMYVYYSCDPAILSADLGLVLGPDDRCLAAPNPAVIASATFTDTARINMPAKANKNIVYVLNNHSINWEFANLGATQIFGQMNYSPRITIESDALNDPAAIDPTTGLPMNGSYTTTGNGTKFSSMILAPGASFTNVESYTRANTIGFSRQFFANLGLPQSVINDLFNKPMTIRLGGRISVRGVSFGQFAYSARFLGN